MAYLFIIYILNSNSFSVFKFTSYLNLLKKGLAKINTDNWNSVPDEFSMSGKKGL